MEIQKLNYSGRIVIVKTLIITEIPTSIIYLLNKILMEYMWKGKNPKITHSTFCNKCENDGLENVDAFSKVVSLQ